MPMYATSPAHHTLRYLINPATFGEGVSYCSSSLCFCICSLLGPDIFPESYSRTFCAWDFTQYDRPSSTPIQTNTQYNYYLIFEVSGGATEHSEHNGSTCFFSLIRSYLSFVHATLISHCLFQIPQLRHTFKPSACYLYAVILFHSLLSSHEHRTIRSSLGIYF
jgi:hypothetical protein